MLSLPEGMHCKVHLEPLHRRDQIGPTAAGLCQVTLRTQQYLCLQCLISRPGRPRLAKFLCIIGYEANRRAQCSQFTVSAFALPDDTHECQSGYSLWIIGSRCLQLFSIAYLFLKSRSSRSQEDGRRRGKVKTKNSKRDSKGQSRVCLGFQSKSPQERRPYMNHNGTKNVRMELEVRNIKLNLRLS